MASVAIPPFPNQRNPNSSLGQQIGTQSYSPPRLAISVSDVERLAKAGVQVRWEDIAAQVHPDDPQKDRPPKLIDALRERLYAPIRARHGNDVHDPRRVFGIYDGWVATAYYDKVYVFGMWADRAPMILEDDINLYPSDGLVTKIRLIEDTIRGNRNIAHGETQSAGQAPTTQPSNFRA